MTSLSFCLHQDGGFSKLSAKICLTLAINLHIFWFDFNLYCIRNDIVLRVYFKPKCNENWRKAAYHAGSDSIQRVVSGMCVCDVRLPNFALVILPGKLIMGDKIFVQNKIFSRPTDPTFWAVCNRNQTIILSRP